MMKISKAYFVGFIIILFCCSKLFAQKSTALNPLKIGDRVPEIKFDYVLNYKYSKASLNGLKRKLTILDLWSTSCTSCIALFPHMDSLQKQFGEDVQIVLVNIRSRQLGDDITKIKKVFERLASRNKKVNLPVVYNSVELDKYFPAKIIPHEIWIDSVGRVFKITSSSYVTAENIRSYLSGENFYAEVKNDLMGFDMTKPLFGNSQFTDQYLLNRTSVYSYIDGLGGISNGLRKNERIITQFFANQPILDLYKEAVFPFSFFSKRLVLEVKDSSRFFMKESQIYDEWINKNGYCYEVTGLASSTIDDLRKSMLQDLNKYLGLYGRIEKRNAKCLVLIKISQPKASNANMKSENNFYDEDATERHMYNQPISVLIQYLNNASSLPLVVDESNFKENIDLKLPGNLNNKEELRKALQQQGFDLVEAEREMEVFVLSEKDWKGNAQ